MSVKKYQFGQMEWEVVTYKEKYYFLLKDLLKYFNYSPSSQGGFIDHVKDRNKIKLTADHREITQHLTHISAGRGWIVNQAGIRDFVKAKKGTDKHDPGVVLLNWIKTVQMQKEHQPKPEQVDLMDFIYEEEIIALKKVVVNQSERIDHLEKRVADLEKRLKEMTFGSVIKEEGQKKMVDVDAFIDLLKKSDARGNIK